MAHAATFLYDPNPWPQLTVLEEAPDPDWANPITLTLAEANWIQHKRINLFLAEVLKLASKEQRSTLSHVESGRNSPQKLLEAVWLEDHLWVFPHPQVTSTRFSLGLAPLPVL